MKDADPPIEQLRQWLDEICRDIAIKYGLINKDGRPRKAFVLDTLLRYACHGCIHKVLLRPNNGRADALYIQNHELAVGLLVECLRQTLEMRGFNFKIGQEANGIFGRPDVLVKPTDSGVLVELGDLEIVVEVKTGSWFSYSQLIRYWLERPKATCIVWRVVNDQVLVVDPLRHHAILKLCLLAAIRRGTALLNGEVKDCHHNPAGNDKAGVIDAQRILESYFEALQKSLPKIVSTVCEIVEHHAKAWGLEQLCR